MPRRNYPVKKEFKKKYSGNQKVRNAQKLNYDGIEFKSHLEVNCYKKLKENGLHFEYEKHKFTLFEGFKPEKFQCYIPNKQGDMALDTVKVRDMGYTPDFVGENWIIETKGFANSVYPLKLKMFRKFMENNSKYKLFAEPHNLKQIDQVIKLIKEL